MRISASTPAASRQPSIAALGIAGGSAARCSPSPTKTARMPARRAASAKIGAPFSVEMRPTNRTSPGARSVLGRCGTAIGLSTRWSCVPRGRSGADHPRLQVADRDHVAEQFREFGDAGHADMAHDAQRACAGSSARRNSWSGRHPRAACDGRSRRRDIRRTPRSGRPGRTRASCRAAAAPSAAARRRSRARAPWRKRGRGRWSRAGRTRPARRRGRGPPGRSRSPGPGRRACSSWSRCRPDRGRPRGCRPRPGAGRRDRRRQTA